MRLAKGAEDQPFTKRSISALTEVTSTRSSTTTVG